MNKGLKIFLVITAVILTGAITMSIMGPVKANKERDQRYVSVIAQLQDIGALQKEYYNQTNTYTKTVDSLISFADTALYRIKERTVTTVYEKNNQGISIPRDVIEYKEIARIPVKDSIFKGRDYKGLAKKKVGDMSPYHLEVIDKVTLNEDSTEFVHNYFFKAYADKKEVLDGMSENYVYNEIHEGKGIRDEIISIGSLIMQSTEGNWTPELDFQARKLKEEEAKKAN